MSFGQFLSILAARKWVAISVLGVTVLLALALSFLLPAEYTAEASVVADFKPDPVASILAPGLASPAFMATQVDIIQSERVARRVVRNLKLAENPQVRQQWQEDMAGEGDIETWLVALFQKKMDVRPSRESSVITVTYKAPDPNFAAALANAFVQAYLETSLELRVNPAKQYTNFFDVRAKEARDVLEAAQAKLSAFQKDSGIIASDERFDDEMQRLNELTSQSVLLQTMASEASSRQAQVGRGAGDRMQEVINNPLIAGLKADLSRSEARLQELSSRLGDRNPQVVELKSSIDSLRERIQTETQKVTGGLGVSNSIAKQRESEVRSALEQQRAKVLRLKTIRDQGAVLMRDVESAQLAYQAVTARFNQSSLESQATQSNVNVLTAAMPPIEPSFPKIPLNVALSLFVGSFVAIGTALALELVNRRVRGPQDIALSIGSPLIGVLPGPDSNSKKKSALDMQRRVLGRLSGPSKAA